VRLCLNLEPSAGSLFARLFSRRGAVFRIDALQYVDVPDPGVAAQLLVQAGLAWPRRLIPLHKIIACHTVPELKQSCKVQGLRQSGRRQALVERLLAGGDRSSLLGPCIRLRHSALFRRLARIYLQSHSGDLSRVVLDAIGVQCFARYAPTGGPTLFQNRARLLAYEDAVAVLSEERDEAGWAAMASTLLAAVVSEPVQSPARRKFCARRLYARSAFRSARAVERVHGPQEAIEVYRKLMRSGAEEQSAARLRLALCLGRAGRAEEGATLCEPHLGLPQTGWDGLALERTGRRLARSCGRSWLARPGLSSASERTWRLPLASRHPPRFSTPDGPMAVEPAVVADLHHRGREALHGESAPWTTLFGLLFHSAIFAPVPGMLPTRCMSGPMDLYLEGFAERRRSIIAGLVSRIQAGEAEPIIRETVAAHHGEQIAGVHWNLMTVEGLCRLARAIGPDPLCRIMTLFAEQPGRARSGMPDLLILPGEGAGLRPGLILAELKAPGDALRDNQRWWHHGLLQAGLEVEVWRVEDSSPS
jgi:hypothetical protein